jgi:kynurenine formamidase
MCGPQIVSDEDKTRIAAYQARFREVTHSPFGREDQIGMLNLITMDSVSRVLSEIEPGRVFDLATDYFVGMPNWIASGDPTYQIWMSHTPTGTVVDDLVGVGREENELVSYSGDCIAMYTHCGTHVDTLSHFGYKGQIFNGFSAAEHLGSRHWDVAGADKHPPVIARGVMIDVAAAQGVDVLPPSFAIGEAELRDALERQRTEVRVGDVALVRTGRMTLWPDANGYIRDEPGLNREGAEFLAKCGVVMVGSDNIAIEQLPTADPENWQVVHTYLLAEAGIPLLEIANLEELSRERLFEFAFFGACLRLRGATGSPMRPIVLPLKN